MFTAAGFAAVGMSDTNQMTYRESDAFRASRAKTARKRYWRNPERERQRSRDYRRRQMTTMTERQAKYLAEQFNDADYQAKKMRGQWVVWCHASEHVVEFDEAALHSEPTYENQLWHARKLMSEKGRDALNNPHAMIGRTCRCGSCFCCAAAQVLKEDFNASS
jgi:hypothetical protein